MKHLILTAAVGLLLFSCSEEVDNGEDIVSQDPNTEESSNPTDSTNSTTKSTSASNGYTYNVVLNDSGNEWGYQLFQGNNMVIKQMHIPAIQGNYGFETKEKAEIAAQFVLNKLENNIFPPAISPEELDSLGVLPENL